MKKREPVKKKDNVFFFPDLEKRLTEKGLDSLHSRKYVEAVGFLEEARELAPENEEILIGLVLAYFESAAFRKAKELAKEMLLKGIGEYLQMVDLYLTILIQLHEYQEVVSTIEALTDEKEIPPEKYDHFMTILQFSRRMAESHLPIEEDKNGNRSSEEFSGQELNLFALTDPKEQMLLVSKLTDKNIRPFIREIKDYLCAETGHPFFKTLLLNLLKEQEYEKQVTVQKFNLERVFVPAELPNISTQSRMMEVLDDLKDRLENSDPVLFANLKSLVERHFLIVYPFILEPLDAHAWAAAFHATVLEYYGMGQNLSQFSSDYGVPREELEKASALIKEIEEISYPII